MVSWAELKKGDTGMEWACRSSTGAVEKVEAVDTTMSDRGRIVPARRVRTRSKTREPRCALAKALPVLSLKSVGGAPKPS